MKRKLLLLLFIFILLLPSLTFARSLSIDNYSIDYTLNSNGLINVSENLTYTLDGCYTELYLQKPISLEILNASGLCVNKECNFRHDLTGTPTGDQELVLKGNYCDETVKLNFSYDIVNLINKLQDGKFQFFYKMYGEDTYYDTNLNLSLTIPGDFKDTEYFLHSKGHDLKITNNKMLISKNVIVNEIIEINLLMPNGWFENTEYIQNDVLTSFQVKEFENNWEKEYDKYYSSITPLPLGYKLLIYFILLFVPFFSLLFIWKKYSKEYSRKQINFYEEYFRELPYKDQDPLLANYFLNENFSSNWFSSAIMYLTWKEVYSLDKEDNNYFLQRTNKEIVLPNYIQKIDLFLQKYFKKNKFNVKDIKNMLNGFVSFDQNIFEKMKTSSSFKKDFLQLNKEIKKEGDSFFKNKKYYDTSGKKIAGIFGIIFFPLALILCLLVLKKLQFLFLVFILVLVSYLVLINSKYFGKFTKEGKIINLRWLAFKKYITDFSDIKNHPPKHVVLWEEYLVYATAFGIAKKVSKNMKIVVPKDNYNNSRLAIYSSFVVSSSFSSLNSISSSASNSGSGGGFGGGSGGGGAGGR
jgi:uncharacterized membrane protein